MDAAFLCFAVILVGCNKNESPKQAFEEYINLWNDREFAICMIVYLNMPKKRFLKRNSQRNIKNL